MSESYPIPRGMAIEVEAEWSRELLTFTITDSGIPFDPTTLPNADITLSAEKRSVGGLGIFLVRQIMDTVEYQRLDEKNILRLKKQL